MEFEYLVPYVNGEGDTGLTARLKWKRNFDKIKAWIEGYGGGSGVLEKDLVVNFKPNVGYLNGSAGIRYQKGTPIETVLRNILYQEQPVRLTVSVSDAQPASGTRVTLTATFDPGTSALTVVSWQWFVDDADEPAGSGSSQFQPTETSGTHQYKLVATLSDDSEKVIFTTVTWSEQVATLTLSPPQSQEAEVGDTVTFNISYNAGTTGVTSPKFVPSKGTISGNVLTVAVDKEGEETITVTAKDGDDNVLCSGQAKLTGYYKWFAGKVATEQASEVDITRLEQSGFIKGSPFEIPEFDVTNWRCIALAVPSAKRVTLFHAVTDGFTSDMLSDDDYMSDTTKAYRNTTYKVVDVFADASTSKSTIKISVI